MNETRKPSPEEMETLRAVLGIDAETFQRSNLGRYIFDRAELDEGRMMEELFELSLKSSDIDITRKGMEIAMQRTLPKYINDAISSGRAAEKNIHMEEAAASED